MVLGGGIIISMKKILGYSIMGFVSFAVNFGIYNYSFNIQATPFLHEAQRVDSGLLMLKTSLPAYLVSSILFTLLFYLISRSKSKSY